MATDQPLPVLMFHFHMNPSIYMLMTNTFIRHSACVLLLTFGCSKLMSQVKLIYISVNLRLKLATH